MAAEPLRVLPPRDCPAAPCAAAGGRGSGSQDRRDASMTSSVQTLFRSSISWALPLLLVAVAAVYLPGLGGGYTFDDMPNIVDNAALRVHLQDDWRAWLAAAFSSPASDLQRPLAM